MRAPKKATNRFPACLPIIQRPMIYIHAYEFIGQLATHIAGKLQRVLNRVSTMFEAETDAGSQNIGNGVSSGWVETFVNDVSAEWQGEALIFARPPRAQIFAHFQTLFP